MGAPAPERSRRNAPKIIVQAQRQCQRKPLHGRGPTPRALGTSLLPGLWEPSRPTGASPPLGGLARTRWPERERELLSFCPHSRAHVEKLWIVWTAEGS